MIISRRVFIRNESHEPLKGVPVEIYDTRTGKVLGVETTDAMGMVAFTRISSPTNEYWFRPRITRTSGKFDKMALTGVVNIHAELEQPPPPPPPPGRPPAEIIQFEPPANTPPITAPPYHNDQGGPLDQPSGVTEYEILWDCYDSGQLEGYDITLATEFGTAVYLSGWQVISMVTVWSDASYWVLFHTATDYRLRHYSATGSTLTTLTLDTAYAYFSVGYDGTYLYVTATANTAPTTPVYLQKLSASTGSVVASVSDTGSTTSGVYASQNESTLIWMKYTGAGAAHELEGYDTDTLVSVWGPTTIDALGLQGAVMTNVSGQFFVAIAGGLGNVSEVQEYLITDGTLIDTVPITVTAAEGGMAWYDTQFFIPEDGGVVNIFSETGVLVDSVTMTCAGIGAIIAKPSPE